MQNILPLTLTPCACVLCICRRDAGDGEEHYAYPNLDDVTTNKQEISENVYSESPASVPDPDRYKLNIDVP